MRGERESRRPTLPGPDRFEETQNSAGVEHRERQADRGPGEENHDGLAEAPAQELARRHADGAEESVLAVTLEQTELKEHPDETECREDQEETHAEEQAAEIHGRLRGALRAGAHVAEEQLVHLGPQRAKQRALQFVSLPARVRKAQGGEAAPARGPHLTTRGNGEKRFRRALKIIPVALVHIANAVELERKARVPIALVLRVADAGKVGHPRAVGREAL